MADTPETVGFLAELYGSLPRALATLIVAGVAGGLVSTLWALYQKRREVYLDTLKQFQVLYGEFFAIWKLWRYHSISAKSEKIESLLERAAAAEGNVEAITLKLCGERKLTDCEIRSLGSFR